MRTSLGIKPWVYYKPYQNSPARSALISPWRRTAQPPNHNSSPPPWPVQNPTVAYNNRSVRPPPGWDGTRPPKPEVIFDVSSSSHHTPPRHSSHHDVLHVDMNIMVDKDLTLRHHRPVTAQNKTPISRTMMNSSVLLTSTRTLIKSPVGIKKRFSEDQRPFSSSGNRFLTARPGSTSPMDLTNAVQWSTTSPCSMNIFH
jgi:hypothetical protein